MGHAVLDGFGDVFVSCTHWEQIKVFLLALRASAIASRHVKLVGGARAVAHGHGETLACQLIEVEISLALPGFRGTRWSRFGIYSCAYRFGRLSSLREICKTIFNGLLFVILVGPERVQIINNGVINALTTGKR